jgi:hypothetical protein
MCGANVNGHEILNGKVPVSKLTRRLLEQIAKYALHP